MEAAQKKLVIDIINRSALPIHEQAQFMRARHAPFMTSRYTHCTFTKFINDVHNHHEYDTSRKMELMMGFIPNFKTLVHDKRVQFGNLFA